MSDSEQANAVRQNPLLAIRGFIVLSFVLICVMFHQCLFVPLEACISSDTALNPKHTT